ncbi:MAG: tetratricopeptide repeat protein [Thermodesulfobacteriota bacterium]
MLNIQSLLKKTSEIEQTDILHSGFASWIVWSKNLPGSIPQTLTSFGGWKVAAEEGQALWFFPDKDILPAWAQISKWMRINPIVVKVGLFPCKFIVGPNFKYSVSMDEECSLMQTAPGKKFQVWAHPNLKDASSGMPGIAFEKPYSTSEAPGNNWLLFNPSEQISYTPTLSWLFVVDPVGKKREKHFLNKWRKFREIFSDLAQKLDIKYTNNEKYEYIFLLENSKQLSSWIQGLVDVFEKEKDSTNKVPCLYVGVEKGDMVLNPSVLSRLSIDWSQLEPDFFYLPLKTIFQLGDEVSPLNAGIGLQGRKISDLFQVDTGSGGAAGRRNLQIYLPSILTSGQHAACFYCGLKGHAPDKCSTRNLMADQSDVWSALEKMNLDEIAAGLEKMGKKLSAGKQIGELQNTGSDCGLLAQAILEINSISQLRTLRKVMRSRGRKWPEDLRTKSESEDSFLRTALENMRMGEHSFAAQKLREACSKAGNDYKPRTLRGFLAMEEGRYRDAHNDWTEAESLSYTPLQRGYHVFLRGRLQEVEGSFEKALQTYTEALKISPDMLDARYRQGVCLVKLGFPDQALGIFSTIMENNPEIFLQAIIDPEMGRGHLHLLSGFYDIWEQVRKRAEQSLHKLDELKAKIHKWFDVEHPAREEFLKRLEAVAKFKDADNYTATRKLNVETAKLGQDLQKRINQGIYELKKKRDIMLEELRVVEKEYSWFPFQHFFLRRTNRLFNDCALRLNNFGDLSLEAPDGFKQGYSYIKESEEILNELRQNLGVVSKFRDMLLFVFFMFKSFLFLEALALILGILVVPLSVFLGLKGDQQWAQSLFAQKWAAQKMGLLVVSIVSFGLAAVLTTLRFERLKEKYFKKFR